MFCLLVVCCFDCLICGWFLDLFAFSLGCFRLIWTYVVGCFCIRCVLLVVGCGLVLGLIGWFALCVLICCLWLVVWVFVFGLVGLVYGIVGLFYACCGRLCFMLI